MSNDAAVDMKHTQTNMTYRYEKHTKKEKKNNKTKQNENNKNCAMSIGMSPDQLHKLVPLNALADLKQLRVSLHDPVEKLFEVVVKGIELLICTP